MHDLQAWLDAHGALGGNNPLAVIGSSFLLVAASEIGDKTQLLAFSLAARFRRPWPILAGILVATLLNHGLASTLGTVVAHFIAPSVMAIIVGVAFIAFGLWTLKPDALEDDDKPSRFGPFLTTIALFFLAEMGDKTQLATVALAARFQAPLVVTAGTTLAMMLVDGVAVFAGDRLSKRVQSKWLRVVAAVLFFAFGVVSFVSAWLNWGATAAPSS